MELSQTPKFNIPQFDIPKLNPIMPDNSKLLEAMEEAKGAQYASGFHKRLSEYIIDFENSLDKNEEVAIKLVTFGESITVIVDDLGYYNPSLISFYGTNAATGDRVQLIQHISQISFLLTAIKTETPKPESERIGFKLRKDLEDFQGNEKID